MIKNYSDCWEIEDHFSTYRTDRRHIHIELDEQRIRKR